MEKRTKDEGKSGGYPAIKPRHKAWKNRKLRNQLKGNWWSRPVSRVLSRTAIHLGCTSPRTSGGLPGSGAGRAIAPLFGLAPGGVCHAVPVTRNAVRSYRTFSPLPVLADVGGMFSVALSVGSRRPGVTWHPALWSPDFPPRASGAAVWPTPGDIIPIRAAAGRAISDADRAATRRAPGPGGRVHCAAPR